MPSVTLENLQEALLQVQSPYQITDHKTSLQILKPHRDPKLTCPETIEDVHKFMAALTEDMDPHCDEVYPGIYIGNMRGIQNIQLLKSNGVTHILNAAEGDAGLSYVPKSILPPMDDFCYNGLEINDTEPRNHSFTFDQYLKAADIIEKAIDVDKGKIFVSCYIGTSRSATCVLFYLVKKRGYDPVNALKEIKAKRDIRPSNEALCHLANLYNDIHGFPKVSGENIPMDPFRLRLRKIYGKE